MPGIRINEIDKTTAKNIEQITAAKARTAFTVRLTPEMYDFLSSMSAETGIPLSTLVDRGLTIGIMVSAKLEDGKEASWSGQTMVAKPVQLTIQEPEKQAAAWSGRVSGIVGHPHITEEDITAQGIRRNKGEL